MKQRNDTHDENTAELPFRFRKEKVSQQKVSEHWDKIAARIAEEKPGFSQKRNKT